MSEQTKTALLPCPFCGAKALDLDEEIACSECGCSLHSQDEDNKKLTKLWNHRSPTHHTQISTGGQR